jgi:monoamine oxidase
MRDVSEFPREAYERCAATFVWWGDPYSLGVCTANPQDVRQPAGYTLPYWMGRYYGFIGEGQ